MKRTTADEELQELENEVIVVISIEFCFRELKRLPNKTEHLLNELLGYLCVKMSDTDLMGGIVIRFPG